jgi:lipopolysaccharide transport system permease protein
MIITPAGVAIDVSPEKRMSRWWGMVRRIGLLVHWNLRKRIYDKSTGALFLIVEPMMQALLFFYIIHVVFGVRGDDVSSVSIFTLVTLWRGHLLITTNAPYHLSGQAGLLQQSRYPPAALIAEGIATDIALFSMLIVIVLSILIISGSGPHASWLAFPAILFVNLLFSSACAVIIACAGIYLRELGLIMGFFVTLWMYASPVVYGMERINEPFRTIYTWTNPMAHIMPAYRDTLLNGKMPAVLPLIVVVVVSLLMLWAGFAWVKRLRGRIYRYL